MSFVSWSLHAPLKMFTKDFYKLNVVKVEYPGVFWLGPHGGNHRHFAQLCNARWMLLTQCMACKSLSSTLIPKTIWNRNWDCARRCYIGDITEKNQQNKKKKKKKNQLYCQAQNIKLLLALYIKRRFVHDSWFFSATSYHSKNLTHNLCFYFQQFLVSIRFLFRSCAHQKKVVTIALTLLFAVAWNFLIFWMYFVYPLCQRI